MSSTVNSAVSLFGRECQKLYTLAAWPRTEFECDVGYVLADATAPGVSKKEIASLAVGKIHQDGNAAEAMKQMADSR